MPEKATDWQRETAARVVERCMAIDPDGWSETRMVDMCIEAMQAQQAQTEDELTTEWARDRYISSLQSAAKSAKDRAEKAERERDEVKERQGL